MAGPVVLAGGTGGAKLARGVLDVAGAELTVVANTGDDVEVYGAYVSPDPDLVAFWLADLIDERGWGLAGDTFAVMDQLRELGEDVWFELGDRDLAIGLQRARRLAAGERLTDAHLTLCESLGVHARVLPMSDAPVRTRVRSGGRWWAFQEYMIRAGGKHGGGAAPVAGVEFGGAEQAAPAPEVLEAIATASAIVVGPSNPIASIAPILALPGMRDALRSSPAAVVAVSPFVGGEVLKGPTREFMDWAGHECSARGVAAVYRGLLDGVVADERAPDAGVPLLQTATLMDSPAARERLARETLGFAAGLRNSLP